MRCEWAQEERFCAASTAATPSGLVHGYDYDGPTMGALFSRFSSLCVMKESSLVTASGIESCPQLETLWVTECSLTTPLGIDKVNALVRYGSNRRSVLSALSIALIA